MAALKVLVLSRAVTATSGIVRRESHLSVISAAWRTRSHRDFRNREAEVASAISGDVGHRAVTATSGIVRRTTCSPRAKAKSSRSHRDFRNREAEFGDFDTDPEPDAQSPRLQES